MEGAKSMKTDKEIELMKLMEGQTPIEKSELDLFGILDQIAWIQTFGLKQKSIYGKNAFYSMARSLFARFMMAKKKTIYRFVPVSFFLKYIARKMKEVKGVLKCY